MGDAASDAQERGLAALERARALDKAGKTQEAAVLYKEHIACFKTAMRAPNLSGGMRKLLSDSIEEWQKRVAQIEPQQQGGGEGLPDYFADLPEAPTTKPVSRPSSRAGASRGATYGAGASSSGEPAKAEEDEKKGNSALTTAMDLHERGRRTSWAQAGDKDKALAAYTQAAECYFAALAALKQQAGARGGKETSAKDIEARLTTKLKDAMSRAEDIKGVVKKATPATPTQQQQPRKSVGHPRSPARPSQGELSSEEVMVLRDSSTVNGKLFLPWIEQDLQETFAFNKPWTDPDGLLSLSEPQREKLVGWSRPSQVMPGEPHMINNVNPYSIKQDLITDCSFVASLCIASAFERRFHKQLITGIIYPQAWHTTLLFLLLSLLSQDARRMPVYNPAGKYLVKLTVNGVSRKVVVDDLLPTGDRGRLLCSASTDKSELWVSIIEKAYLKVNGGYDFPGSNSGIDLFALTGWLPEQILFEEHRPPKGHTSARRAQPLDNYETAERVWQRLLSAHRFGDCLITVATSNIAEDEAERLGLVPSHAYAVLDVKEVNGTRLLQVKNPWSRKRWRGPYSVEDTQRWTPALKEAVKYDLETAMLKDNGVFWVDFASIFQYFKNVFMNWNPSVFSFRFVMHLRWPVNMGPKNDSFNLGDNPQLSLSVKSSAKSAVSGASGSAMAAAAGGAAAAVARTQSPTVWVLLSRHVTVIESDPAEGDFLTMHVYAGTQGKRVYYPDTPMFKGIYTNNPHTLVRFDLPENTGSTDKWVDYTLVVSQYEKKREVRYSVNVYCSDTFKLYHTPTAPEHARSIVGAWDQSSAGGALGRPLFYTNPQYAVVLTQKTKVHIEVRAPKDFQINATVVSQGGMRIDSVSSEREVMTTGSYRQGFCYAEGILPAGTYTVIFSTYKPGQVAGFVAKLCTTSPVRPPTRIPQEGEGMASKQVVHGRWRQDDGTAAGCSNFGRYLDNPRYLFTVPSRTSILLRVVIPENAGPFPEGRPAVNITLFPSTREGGGYGTPGPPEDTGGTHLGVGKISLNPKCQPTSNLAIASSNGGVYMDSSAGGVTESVEVEAGEYVAVVSSFRPQEADYEITIYTTPALARVQRIMG
ncbi:unnamed protein product [Ectocarpus sp. 12 AP-2014]